MTNIAIFASGSGTNAENIARYFENHPRARISLMISNRKDALVFERMRKFNIPSYYIKKEEFEDGRLLKFLKDQKIDLIILAGFLKLVPEPIINAFEKGIINIHPALLPKFGGKGMYGKHVHEAVINAKETKTGITIHFVNRNFDEGEIISQHETEVTPSDTAETIAAKIHELEMKWFPVIIEKIV